MLSALTEVELCWGPLQSQRRGRGARQGWGLGCAHPEHRTTLSPGTQGLEQLLSSAQGRRIALPTLQPRREQGAASQSRNSQREQGYKPCLLFTLDLTAWAHRIYSPITSIPSLTGAGFWR